MLLRYIPNFLTIIRIIIVPFFIYFFTSDYYSYRLISLILFFVGSLSDFLDGYIARKYNLVTTLGKIIDPLADKILILSAFFLLNNSYPSYVPLWMLYLILFRDIFVTLYRIYLKNKDVVMQANMLAKRKTLFQIVIIHFLLILHVFYFNELQSHLFFYVNAIYFAMVVCTGITLYSGLNYFISYMHDE